MMELKDNLAKIKNLRLIRLRFTKVWRNAYIRHRMRVSRGVVTAEHVAEVKRERETYERLLVKCHSAGNLLAHKQKELKRRIALYQKAALYI